MLKFWLEKLFCGVFSRVKWVVNPQINFSRQNLSIECNFFKWDGKVTKISHLLFHRIWKKICVVWFSHFTLKWRVKVFLSTLSKYQILHEKVISLGGKEFGSCCQNIYKYFQIRHTTKAVRYILELQNTHQQLAGSINTR